MKESNAALIHAEQKVALLEKRLLDAAESAKQDFLTGMLNKRGLDEHLNRIFEEFSRVTLAVLDIDNFKRVNDTFGHAAGDEALKMLAATIDEVLGGNGVAGRAGGEEFVIAFTGYSIDIVSDHMKNLQRALTRKFFKGNGDNQIITFSAGIAERVGEEGPSDVFMRADDAMYTAKQQGKNRVEVAKY